MFIEKIKTHNYLNGYLFSAMEFLGVAIIVAPFLVYYFNHGRIGMGFICLGLIVNFVTVAGFAIPPIRKKEKGIGLRFYTDPQTRKEIGRKYPNLSRDTTILCVSFLIPFCLVLGVLYEGVTGKKRK